jgi:hypothetical protein
MKFRFVGREEVLRVCLSVVWKSFQDFLTISRNKSNWDGIVLRGGSGVGKTRFNLQLLSPSDSSHQPLFSSYLNRIITGLPSELSSDENILRNNICAYPRALSDLQQLLSSPLFLFLDLERDVGIIPDLELCDGDVYKWSSSIFIGLRIAVCYYYPNNAREALQELLISPSFLSHTDVFSLGCVLSDIAVEEKQSEICNRRLVQIGIDEFQSLLSVKVKRQGGENGTENLLKGICREMLIVAISLRSLFCVPVFTGTYLLENLDVFEPTEFSICPVTIPPLSPTQTIDVLTSQGWLILLLLLLLRFYVFTFLVISLKLLFCF